MRRGVFVIATCFVLVAAPAARANDPAAAQLLFEQAQQLMRQERWAEACPKLEESQRLDPADGTLLHLAACREHEGKIATAWAIYQDALVAAKRSNNRSRARVAQERIDVLGPKLHRLRVRVSSADKRLPGFKVIRDDTAVGSALWNDPFPIDPGTHTIAATADGYKRWSQTIDIPTGSGETTVDVPLLDAEPTSARPAKQDDKQEPKRLSIEEATRGDTQRTVGLAIGGIGVAGLVAGTIFGSFAFSKESEANSHCKAPDYTVCTKEGVDAGEQSKQYGNISTAAFIAGGALMLGGAVLYFTAPAHGRIAVAPRIAPGLAALSLSGRF